MSMSIDYDLTIIGGGLVGASLALALRGSGLRIALVEAVARRAASQPSYDDRTLVLNRVSCDWLQAMGLWPSVVDAATPIRQIHVSARGRFGRTVLRAADHRLESFGHVLQARRLGMAVLPVLDALAECRVYCPAQLAQLQVDADATRVILADGAGEFRTRLVVGADGANSKVRDLMGMPAQREDYQQTAVISNISIDGEHHGCAYERFTESGPLALLPHGQRRMGLVWSATTETAPELLALDDSAFLSALQQGFGQRLGPFRRLGARVAYPLQLVHALACVAPRCVLIGNAAHTIHPISAQGFNLGLRDAIALAHHLRSGRAGDATSFDAGEARLLHAYQALREDDQRHTIRYTDGLVRLYRNPSSVFRLLGSAALVAHQFIPPLQRQLVNRAMGYRVALAALS